jgi:CheY-like chemotaxis protein
MKNILIVDDSATSRMLFKVHLPKEHGYVIHEGKDLAGALRLAEEHAPELVVLDYNMPDHNGVEVAQALMDAGIKTRFVLLTANTQQSVVEDAKALNFRLVVEKPITREKIAMLLAEADG